MGERGVHTLSWQRAACFVLIGVVAFALSTYTFMSVSIRSHAASTAVFTSNFEDTTSHWVGSGSITRTLSGTNGITSASGSYHGVVIPSDNGHSGPNTQFGGYNSVWPGEWEASIDTYLDPSWPVDTGFLFSVATNNTAGAFLRDYIIHAGVINDEATDNTNALVVIADNHGAPPDNTTFQIKHPSMRDRRVEVTETGWYTFLYNFHNTDGRLIVDISISKKGGPIIKTWTLDAIDADPQFHVLIPENVGGNRYGWFTHVTVPGGLAIDNVTRSIGSNIYNISQDATDPVSIEIENGQTLKMNGAINGAVTSPIDTTVINPDNNIQVIIPAGTTVSAASPDWDGTFMAPAIQPNDTLSLPGVDLGLVVRVGADVPLNFSQPVKLVLPNQSGKKAGYVDSSNALHPIHVECGNDPDATLIGDINECYQVIGNDLIIWTNHFSTYVAYTQLDVTYDQSDSNAPSVGVPNTGLQAKDGIAPLVAAIIGIFLAILSLKSVPRYSNAKSRP